MSDIRFLNDDYVFSYRVAGICIHKGKVLLQTTTGEDRSFAFPGGHVEFGESCAQALIREWKEEIGTDLRVKELKWVGENFFPWGERTCQQICNYFLVEIPEKQIPEGESFFGREHLDGRDFALQFYWIPLEEAEKLELYPTNARALLKRLDADVQHFVYREV